MSLRYEASSSASAMPLRARTQTDRLTDAEASYADAMGQQALLSLRLKQTKALLDGLDEQHQELKAKLAAETKRLQKLVAKEKAWHLRQLEQVDDRAKRAVAEANERALRALAQANEQARQDSKRGRTGSSCSCGSTRRRRTLASASTPRS